MYKIKNWLIITLHKCPFVCGKIIYWYTDIRTTANYSLYQKCTCHWESGIHFNTIWLSLVEWAESGETQTWGPPVPVPLPDKNLQCGTELWERRRAFVMLTCGSGDAAHVYIPPGRPAGNSDDYYSHSHSTPVRFSFSFSAKEVRQLQTRHARSAHQTVCSTCFVFHLHIIQL